MAITTVDLLTPSAMASVDDRTIAAGTPGTVLMARAGAAIARLCLSLHGRARARIFCGPGNNGGDGYVAAQRLYQAGWEVDLWSLGSVSALSGDAAWAAAQCAVTPKSLEHLPVDLDPCDVFIDGVFGAGLYKPLSVEIAAFLKRGCASARQSIAIDLPSGVSGADGQYMTAGDAAAWRFDHTVTFGAHKFGHVLQPGRRFCGKIWLADIGLRKDALTSLASGAINAPHDVSKHPGLHPSAQDHKYNRGHVAVVAGRGGKDGAGALAAFAALRAGAGLVTLLNRDASTSAPPVKAIMTAECPPAEALQEFAVQRKISALVIGPGLGLENGAADLLDAALDAKIPLVLDADAVTLIGQNGWLDRLTPNMILTPHEGEFARLCPALAGAKVSRFQQALAAIPAVICLKGPDTLIGQGAGTRFTVNVNAPATLATAGSGDVLAGIIAGLWTRNTSALQAAEIGVYLHALAATHAGSGLYADALIEHLGAAITAYKAAPCVK